MDVAQSRDDDEIADDPKRLRPGEIDPNPESKPARPDPIDMDEDEKEMLSEARARLANTKGKKAKRKAREKQLDEARRLASLQKYRELKAAGIPIRQRFRKRKGIDYNEEIPFYQKQPKGFYNTYQEDKLAIENKEKPDFRNLTSETFEGKRRDEIEARERKKDIKRQKLFRQQNLPAAIQQINRLNDPQSSIRMRNPIQLPAPQVSDADLENIARLRNDALSLNGEDVVSSSNLLIQYAATPMINTPRTPVTHQDTIRQEIEDIIAVTQTETPLVGGENIPLHNQSFGQRGAVPKTTVAQTPNVLLTPARAGMTPSMTPNSSFSGSTTPMSYRNTPLRDAFNINPFSNGFSTPSDITLDERRMRKLAKKKSKKLASSFKGLPHPKELKHANIIMPVFEPDDTFETEDTIIEDDAADLDMRRVIEKEAAEQAELKRRSQTLRRELPRPRIVNTKITQLLLDRCVGLTPEIRKAAEILNDEIINIIRFDNAKFPLPNSDIKVPLPKHNEIDDASLKQARKILEKEIAIIKEHRNSDGIVQNDFSKLWIEADNDLQYLPSGRTFGSFQRCDKGEQLQCLQQEFELLRAQLNAQLKKSLKSSTRMDLLTGGYQLRSRNISDKIKQLNQEIQDSNTEHVSFNQIYQREHAAIPLRQESLKHDVRKEMERESILQSKYQNLLEEHQLMEDMIETH